MWCPLATEGSLLLSFSRESREREPNLFAESNGYTGVIHTNENKTIVKVVDA